MEHNVYSFWLAYCVGHRQRSYHKFEYNLGNFRARRIGKAMNILVQQILEGMELDSHVRNLGIERMKQKCEDGWDLKEIPKKLQLVLNDTLRFSFNWCLTQNGVIIPQN
ncbi:hypothetical protein TOT_040000801 [Theileria orientalis strain Shintoku]|uniref:Uncharacterized protein n=1 Tax=Theileria orientalis strain Shintoku TaxID=869250 RepID=J7MF50_THEOR|nr:hypothetical protein TOT_040000801 [Theileria orientalis strain Shintoku]BAM42434.1 hypothetical protein TOT_040000801 [Theileria orientalis strain Shintoku]|eukprot:XP_009692735.1 hypothetical protein TOT_040000801 [Theileria orientalis strain Shintoku]